jgi:glycerol kinase
MQFQADMLGVPVVIPEISETTALGAAYLAGVTTELWSESDLKQMWKEDRRFEPRMSDDQRQSLLADWRRALERSRRWVISEDE